MGATPDRHHGEALEEGIVLDNRAPGSDPPVAGGLRYVDGVFRMRDAGGVFTPSSLTPTQHDALRQLIHLADGGGPYALAASGAYREITPSADPFPTSVIWWTSSGKTAKILEKTITYTDAFPTTIEWKVYDTDGSTVLVTATDVITYTDVFETSRTRTIA